MHKLFIDSGTAYNMTRNEIYLCDMLAHGEIEGMFLFLRWQHNARKHSAFEEQKYKDVPTIEGYSFAKLLIIHCIWKQGMEKIIFPCLDLFSMLHFNVTR